MALPRREAVGDLVRIGNDTAAIQDTVYDRIMRNHKSTTVGI
jgi:hypothetical protein